MKMILFYSLSLLHPSAQDYSRYLVQDTISLEKWVQLLLWFVLWLYCDGFGVNVWFVVVTSSEFSISNLLLAHLLAARTTLVPLVTVCRYHQRTRLLSKYICYSLYLYLALLLLLAVVCCGAVVCCLFVRSLSHALTLVLDDSLEGNSDKQATITGRINNNNHHEPTAFSCLASYAVLPSFGRVAHLLAWPRGNSLQDRWRRNQQSHLFRNPYHGTSSLRGRGAFVLSGYPLGGTPVPTANARWTPAPCSRFWVGAAWTPAGCNQSWHWTGNQCFGCRWSGDSTQQTTPLPKRIFRTRWWANSSLGGRRGVTSWPHSPYLHRQPTQGWPNTTTICAHRITDDFSIWRTKHVVMSNDSGQLQAVSSVFVLIEDAVALGAKTVHSRVH